MYYLNYKNILLLFKKKVSGSVVIDNRKTFTYKFIVQNYEDAAPKNIIIPHFDKYPLQGSKQLDFLSVLRQRCLYSSNK